MRRGFVQNASRSPCTRMRTHTCTRRLGVRQCFGSSGRLSRARQQLPNSPRISDFAVSTRPPSDAAVDNRRASDRNQSPYRVLTGSRSLHRVHTPRRTVRVVASYIGVAAAPDVTRDAFTVHQLTDRRNPPVNRDGGGGEPVPGTPCMPGRLCAESCANAAQLWDSYGMLVRFAALIGWITAR
jgi:hypothetical protein